MWLMGDKMNMLYYEAANQLGILDSSHRDLYSRR